MRINWPCHPTKCNAHITTVNNTLNLQREKRTNSRVLWIIKQGMHKRARSSLEENLLLYTFFLARTWACANGSRFSHLSWWFEFTSSCVLSSFPHERKFFLSLLFILVILEWLNFLPYASEISVLSHLSITIMFMNVDISRKEFCIAKLGN